jgi:mRNA interferase MazF
MSRISRGEIWLADLSPGLGAEPGKARPVLIVQSQVLLDANYATTLVIPLTTQLIDDAEPLRIRVAPADRLRRASDLLVAQLRAIDNRRLVSGPLAKLSSGLLRKVEIALDDVLGRGAA